MVLLLIWRKEANAVLILVFNYRRRHIPSFVIAHHPEQEREVQSTSRKHLLSYTTINNQQQVVATNIVAACKETLFKRPLPQVRASSLTVARMRDYTRHSRTFSLRSCLFSQKKSLYSTGFSSVCLSFSFPTLPLSSYSIFQYIYYKIHLFL